MQGDITTVVNGGLTDSNFAGAAALVESKLAFDTATGHDHDGSNSKAISTANVKHFRKGLTLSGDDDANVVVDPGSIEIGGTTLTAVAASGDIAIATAANWVNGAATASSWCYVYVYNNSGAVGYKFSNEAPDLSYTDDTAAEFPLRYQAYDGIYYRCVGCVFIDAAGDLCYGHASSEGRYLSNFDASTMWVGGGLGTGADQVINTLWTPRYIRLIYGLTDATPADGEALCIMEATQIMLDTTWAGTAFNVHHSNVATEEHEWEAVTTAGTINAITAQSAGIAGSFTIDAMVDGQYWYAMATTDIL